MSIPDEVLNLDSSKLSENTELQTSPATGASDAPKMKVHFAHECHLFTIQVKLVTILLPLQHVGPFGLTL